MAKIADPFDRHEWSSRDYVSRWAEGQDKKEENRQAAFQLLVETIPYGKNTPIKILDVGAGYGGLTQFLLQRFRSAQAVCHDGSAEMAELGNERMKKLKGRFKYALSDFSKKGWSNTMKGQFEAVVSSIAIHNVRHPKTIEAIYKEIYPLVKPGGCFLNFDRPSPSLEKALGFLKEAGFKDVQCFWDGGKRALFGGFRR